MFKKIKVNIFRHTNVLSICQGFRSKNKFANKEQSTTDERIFTCQRWTGCKTALSSKATQLFHPLRKISNPRPQGINLSGSTKKFLCSTKTIISWWDRHQRQRRWLLKLLAKNSNSDIFILIYAICLSPHEYTQLLSYVKLRVRFNNYCFYFQIQFLRIIAETTSDCKTKE